MLLSLGLPPLALLWNISWEAHSKQAPLRVSRPGGDPAIVPAHRIPDNGQAQSCTAGSAGTRLIHPVKAVKHLGQVLLRNTHTGIPHLQQNLVSIPVHRDKYFPTVKIIFDGIFYQIETNLRQIVLGTADDAIRS